MTKSLAARLITREDASVTRDENDCQHPRSLLSPWVVTWQGWCRWEAGGEQGKADSRRAEGNRTLSTSLQTHTQQQERSAKETILNHDIWPK